MTTEEKAWLDNHQELRIAPDPDFPPVEWIDENGVFRGMAADFVALLERRLGIKFKIVRLSNWDEVIGSAKNRQVDILSAVSPSPQREEYLQFTKPHIILPGNIFVRDDVKGSMGTSDLRGKKVTVVSQYVWQDYLANDFPEIELFPAPSVSAALLMVSFGSVDAMVGDLATATYYLQKEGISNLRVAGETEYKTYLSFGSRKDWPQLHSILEKALDSFTSEDIDGVYDKWLNLKPESILGSRKFWVVSATAFGLIVICFGGVILWNRSLQRLIRKKTRQLNNELAEKMRAAEALKENEARFRDLSEMLPETVFEADLDMNLTFVNHKAFSMFGYSQADFEKGLNGYDLFVPEDRKRARYNAVNRLSDENLGASEYSGLRKNGTSFPVLFHTSPLIKNTELVGIRGIVVDLSEQKKVERRLRDAQKMESVGNLAAGIAHDFNNILHAIIGYTELADESLPPEDPSKMMLNEVLKAGARAKNLVQQILLFSRQSDIKMQPVQISLIVKEALKLLRSSIPTTIEIKQHISSDTGTILADATQIHQIIMNLCTNAYHAMRESGGVLTVSLTERNILKEDHIYSELSLPPGSYLLLDVSDTGHGMNHSTLSQIFDPYFTTKKIGEGTGLGLAVVHGIVKACGGEIKVYSEPGQGTSFQIYFPQVDVKTEDEAGQRDVVLRKGRERILLVDDDKTNSGMLKKSLTNLGYSVSAFIDSQETFEAFSAAPDSFDLVITDMTMPKLTGMDLAEKILGIRPKMPIILCTGYSELITREQVQASGIRAFLLKPVLREELSRTIREVLDADTAIGSDRRRM